MNNIRPCYRNQVFKYLGCLDLNVRYESDTCNQLWMLEFSIFFTIIFEDKKIHDS